MATKTFPHAVIYNGKLYAANTAIEINKAEVKSQEVEPTPKKVVTKNDKGTSRKA